MSAGFWKALAFGLVPATITSVHTKPFTADDVPEKLARATMRYCQVLSRLEPRRSRLTVDGESITGDFLLAEVLNIQSVGPNLVLSAGRGSVGRVLLGRDGNRRSARRSGQVSQGSD